MHVLHTPSALFDSDENKIVNSGFSLNTVAQISLPLLLNKGVSDQNSYCWLNNVGLKHCEIRTMTSFTVLGILPNAKAVTAELFFGQNISFYQGRENQNN